MKRLALMGFLAVMLLCSACGKQAEPAELTRVVYARGHGSTWGNQFRMDVCPTEISYTHFFESKEKGRAYRELFAVPIENQQWDKIEAAALELLPRLEVQKPPSLMTRLIRAIGPKEVDGGDWWSLTATWLADGETQDVQYIWAASPEAEAFDLLLKELALSLTE